MHPINPILRNFTTIVRHSSGRSFIHVSPMRPQLESSPLPATYVENERTETRHATYVENERTETLQGMEGLVSLVDGHVINQEIGDVSKGAVIEEAQCNDDDVNTGIHDETDKTLIPRQEKHVVAEYNSKLPFTNVEELVIVESTPVKIEEKVILGEEGKLKDQIHQEDSKTAIHEEKRSPSQMQHYRFLGRC